MAADDAAGLGRLARRRGCAQRVTLKQLALAASKNS
jgi:hypothetical protein